MTSRSTLSTTRKLVASAAVLATAAAFGAGAFAVWNTTATQHQDLGAATVSSTFTTQVGTPWDDADITNMLPGDSVVRYAALTNTGSIEQTFVVNVKGDGDLTAAEDGVKVDIRTCATAWDGAECAGASTTLRNAYITDAGVDSQTLVLAAGSHSFLQIAFTLDAGAAAEFQGECDKFILTVTGVPTDHGDSAVSLDVTS